MENILCCTAVHPGKNESNWDFSKNLSCIRKNYTDALDLTVYGMDVTTSNASSSTLYAELLNLFNRYTSMPAELLFYHLRQIAISEKAKIIATLPIRDRNTSLYKLVFDYTSDVPQLKPNNLKYFVSSSNNDI